MELPDESMANFTINNNKYKSAAYMLCCDDTQRENGNIEKANKMYESCEKKRIYSNIYEK